MSGTSPQLESKRVRYSATLETITGAVTLATVTLLVCVVMKSVESSRTNGSTFQQWIDSTTSSWTAWGLWVIGDVSEPSSYKSPLASLGLIAGALAAYLLWRWGSRWAGFPVSYGFGDRFPWLLGSAGLSLVISNVVFRGLLDGGQWQPTFVVVASVPAGIVLLYGRGWRVLITAAVLGVLTVPPLSMLLIVAVCQPAGIPNVVGIVTAMGIGGLAACAVCLLLPWMRRAPTPTLSTFPTPMRHRHNEFTWTMRRVLADFSEAQFIGNEWAGGLLIAGVCVGYLINPQIPGYGLELIPEILFAQVLASAVGVVLWRRWYRDGGWTATYVPVVSAAPTAVIAFEGSWPALIVGSVLGGILGAPTARLLTRPLSPHFHPFIANVFSMATTTLAVVATLRILF